jgi:uncharacterized protein
MYYEVVSQCVQNLKNLEKCLDELGEVPGQGRTVRGCQEIRCRRSHDEPARAWLSGQKPPKHEDNEKTIAEVRARIRKAVAFAESVTEAQYASASERKVTFSWMPGEVLGGKDYLLQMVIPNTYFHLTTAYAILRHNGVDVGKMDFLGTVNFVDA